MTMRIYNCVFKDPSEKEVNAFVMCDNEENLKQASNLIRYEKTRLRKADHRVRHEVIKHNVYGYYITIRVFYDY